MSQKTITFQLFRYQLLPINRYLQLNFMSEVKSIEDLLEQKNTIFNNALDEVSSFSNKKHETITKKLFNTEDFFIYRIANNRSIHRETKDFKDETIDNWPSVLVAIWNNPEKQLIAVQKRTTAFPSSEVIVKLILDKISPILSSHHLRPIYEPLFKKEEFWSILEKYKGQIKSVEFEMITPNMANISGSLPEDLREFAKQTNSTKNYVKIESDPEAPLHLDKENKTLNGFVDYSSEGGGNIALRIENITKRYHTSKTIKEIELGNVVFEGNPDQIASTLKELLS